MAEAHDVLLKKLQEHSKLDGDDIAVLQTLPCQEQRFRPNQDIVRQGDKPKGSVIVLEGMVARYHALPDGNRQYLSFHIPGDMPDAQTLFIEVLDHAVSAIDEVRIAIVPHGAIIAMFKRRPEVGVAIWRETLIDAAIFRQAITNNSSRKPQTRLAHFLCEQYYRARAGGHARPGSCSLPLTQTQIGEALGMSLISVNRALQGLRRSRSMELRDGVLHVRDWYRLAALGEFSAGYLHLKKPSRL
jgi:CRP-like cAMP-binding protein